MGIFLLLFMLKGVGQIRLRDNTSTGLKDVTLTSEWVRYELQL